jgi:gluconolactonase
MPDHKKIVCAIGDMIRPNGIIGMSNGTRLYVADHGAGKTYSYTINKDGTLTDKQIFALEGSDGMTIDSQGNVYLTGKAVAVYNRKGQKIQEIAVPEGPSNVTFGGKDNQTLFVTARTSLYAIPMEVKGAKTPVQLGRQPGEKPKATRESKRAKEGKRQQQ